MIACLDGVCGTERLQTCGYIIIIIGIVRGPLFRALLIISIYVLII